MKKVIAVGFFVWLLCASFAARADDAEQATLVAQQIHHMIEEDRLNTLWDTLVWAYRRSRPPIPIDRDQCGAGADGAVG
jgi:hypothetical protein